jgi:hypothetical protein
MIAAARDDYFPRKEAVPHFEVIIGIDEGFDMYIYNITVIQSHAVDAKGLANINAGSFLEIS